MKCHSRGFGRSQECQPLEAYRLTGDVVRPAVWRLSLDQWYPEVMHLGDEEFLAAQFPQPKFLVPIEWA